jgi:putative SOS response-associated peptidase YedK
MPVLVPPAAYSAWLDPDLDPSRVRAMCSPAPGDVLTIHRVSRRVSTPGEDGPELIRPEPPPPSQGSLL